MPRAGAWMREHLTTQGSCLTDAERRNLAVGLRFSTNLCLQSDTFAWLERRRTPSDPITS